MFNFDKIDIQRVATAAVGAIILSTVSITAAVGPARAVETASIVAPAQDEAYV
jgi:hypothetical protein